MYAHPQDRNVIRIIGLSFILLILIDFSVIFLLKIGGLQVFDLNKLKILENTVLYLCCFFILYLYLNMLKVDAKKTLNQKFKLCMLIILDLITSQLFIFWGSLKIPLIADTKRDLPLMSDTARIFQLFSLVIFGPFLEEIIFRRFLYQLIKKDKQLYKSLKEKEWKNILIIAFIMIINSALFAVLHYDDSFVNFFSWPFLYFFVSGLNLCFCCEICNTITSSMTMHILYNFIVLVRALL